MSQKPQVVTVTLNPAIDQTLTIPAFKAGAVNRVRSVRLDPGGKGVNVASFLHDAGVQVTVTGFLGEDNDLIFRRFFAAKGIEDRFIRIPGPTRTGVKIVDAISQQTTDINFTGETPAPGAIRRLLDLLREMAKTTNWFVLAGSVPGGVPPEVYRQMATVLVGKQIVLDTSGEALRLAVPAGPAIIKPNARELGELVGEKLSDPESIVKAAQGLRQRYGVGIVAVSMGQEGAIFIDGNAAVWAVPPAVEAKSTVGAGDAMVAGIVTGVVSGLSLDELARLSTAFSVSRISRVGAGLPPQEVIDSLMEQVTVRELSVVR